MKEGAGGGEQPRGLAGLGASCAQGCWAITISSDSTVLIGLRKDTRPHSRELLKKSPKFQDLDTGYQRHCCVLLIFLFPNPK